MLSQPRGEKAFEQALRDRDWAVRRDGDNTGALHFGRPSESRECCHCPPAADAMPHGIFQYTGTAWGGSWHVYLPSGALCSGFGTGQGQILGRGVVVLQGRRSQGGEEHHPSTGRGRAAWSQCQWTHLPVSFPPLVSQGLVSPCSALAAQHPHQTQGAQEGVCSPSRCRGAIPSTAGAGPPAGSACLQPRDHQNGNRANTVLPALCPGEHHGSGHAKGFRAFVDALQLALFQRKHDNSSSFFASSDF